MLLTDNAEHKNTRKPKEEPELDESLLGTYGATADMSKFKLVFKESLGEKKQQHKLDCNETAVELNLKFGFKYGN